MPNFKPKSKKKINVPKKKNITLDSKHKELVSKFENYKNVLIPNLKNEIKILKLNIKTETDIEKKMENQDLLKKKKKKFEK